MEVQNELKTAWAYACEAVKRAEEQNKRLVGIQLTKAAPGFRLLAIDDFYADRTRRTSFRFDGFTLRDWTENLIYAMADAGCFQHACKDDLDDFLPISGNL